MHISDFAIVRASWTRYTPWPARWLGALVNYIAILVGLALSFGAATAGVALAWKWFS